MHDVRTFEQIESQDISTVGGKGLSLGLLASAGLPVPPGFCVTSSAHRRLKGRPASGDRALADEVTQAYSRLGGGPVAVRSSATAEDGAVTSFAGQQETILGVTGEKAVLEAIGRCWASLDSERAVAYRRRQGVEEAESAMAVVVQRLVPAEVSGVLFTNDPLDPEGRSMLIEGSWGLGESVVSGRVTPDRFRLDRDTLKVRDQYISTKQTEARFLGETGSLTWQNVPAEKQTKPCLDAQCLAELAELGRRVEAFYGNPRDVEWAWAEGRFWLLQARPITTASAAEREQVRREEIASLTGKAKPEGTVWSRYNLAEVLPEPTPMTWELVRGFMSGQGGFGLMYRDLGFLPAPALDEDGIYDLVCGRPYCNLSREPGLYANGLPFEHSFAELKAAPLQALYPKAAPNWSRAGWRFWLFLPVVFLRTIRLSTRLHNLQKTFADEFRTEILPSFAKETTAADEQILTSLSDAALLGFFKHWVQRSLYDFARDSLKPTVLAALVMTNLEQLLVRRLGQERSRVLLSELVMGIRPDPDADFAGALREVAAGRLEKATFLQRFGHRGSQEMELSKPRWAEDASALKQLGGPPEAEAKVQATDAATPCDQIGTEAKLAPAARTALREQVELLHTYLGLRETAKHYLMKGYALIRRALVEFGRRTKLGNDVFYLLPTELPDLIAGKEVAAIIAGRKRRRLLALSLDVPQVLFSDDLEAIGRPITYPSSETLQGVPLSVGVAEGPALVLGEPIPLEPPSEPYVLVCPSTDPAWVPLFVHARALVMETGGVLSHGAIVAREFGLPAVAGLPGIVEQIKTGRRLRVDGTTGQVNLL